MADDELATVARLRAHEEELTLRLQEARRTAEARVFEARDAAARAETLAEADCRQELARLREERTRALGAVLDGIGDESARLHALLVERAAANRARVLTRVVQAVTGGGTR